MQNPNNKKLTPLTIALSSVVLSLQTQAATVNFRDFDNNPVGRISQNELNAAARAAGDNGRINFENRTYRFRTQVNVSRRGITLSGPASGRASFVYDGPDRSGNPSLLGVNAPNVTLNRISFSGQNRIEFADVPSDQNGQPNGLAGIEGLRASVGLEYGVRVLSPARNLEITSCAFLRTNVGIGYERDFTPSGLRVTNTQFTTHRGMINAIDSRDVSGNVNFPRNFILTNADYVGRAGVTARGFTFDYGNSEGPTINVRRSIIQGCNIRRMSNFNMDINRFSNYIIRGNTLNGGGAFGRVRFGHCLHFEDEGENIRIRNNVLRQTITSSNVERTFSHIWTGGNNGLPTLSIAGNNTYRGIPQRIVIPNR